MLPACLPAWGADADSAGSEKKLATGAVVGIVVDSVALASVLAALLTFALLCRRSKYSRSKFGKEILLMRAISTSISRPLKHDVILCHYLARVCKI